MTDLDNSKLTINETENVNDFDGILSKNILKTEEKSNENEPKEQINLINIAKEVLGKSGDNYENSKSKSIIQTVQKSIDIIQAPEKKADLIIDVSSKVNVKDLLDKGIEIGHNIESYLNEKDTEIKTKSSNEINQELFELQKVNDSELNISIDKSIEEIIQVSYKNSPQNLVNSFKIIKTNISNNQDELKTETEVAKSPDYNLKNQIERVDPMKSCKILIISSMKYLSILILLVFFGFCLYLFGYMTIQLNGILTGLQNFGMLLNITFSFLVDFMMSSKSAKVSPV